MHPRTISRSLLALIALLMASQPAWADPSRRSDNWQLTLSPMYTGSVQIKGEGDASADLNARTSFMLGFGYNVNEHLELGMDMGSGSADYSGTYTDNNGDQGNFRTNYYISFFNINGTYNFLPSRLTPYVSANLGWSYIDSGIPTGDVGEICWWDPWYWTWICSPYAQTYSDSRLNYGADIGLRYDISRSVFIKGAIGQNYIDFKNVGATGFTNFKFALGFMF